MSNTQSSRCSSENKVTRSEMSCRWETKAFKALNGWEGHYFGQFVQHHNNKVLKIIKTLKLRKKRKGRGASFFEQPAASRTGRRMTAATRRKRRSQLATAFSAPNEDGCCSNDTNAKHCTRCAPGRLPNPMRGHAVSSSLTSCQVLQL